MLLLVWLGSPAVARGPVQLDPRLESYRRTSGVAGNLSSVGSDTLNNLMTLWAEGFQSVYPNVHIQIEGKGSSTAPPALIEGTAQIGPMSRRMKASEVDLFDGRFGYRPTVLRIAVDALAVVVNKDNPLEELTLTEVDAIFSRNRTCGDPDPIRSWGEAGVPSPAWSSRPISLYGRNSASGTYGYFKRIALCGGDFRAEVQQLPGSASVVQAVTQDVNGIGYTGIGYRTAGVKMLRLATEEGEPDYGTDPEPVLSGRYPLARYLYLYVNKAPNQPLDPLLMEFLRFVGSREGQGIVVKTGYLPIPYDLVRSELAKLE